MILRDIGEKIFLNIPSCDRHEELFKSERLRNQSVRGNMRQYNKFI